MSIEAAVVEAAGDTERSYVDLLPPPAPEALVRAIQTHPEFPELSGEKFRRAGVDLEVTRVSTPQPGMLRLIDCTSDDGNFRADAWPRPDGGWTVHLWTTRGQSDPQLGLLALEAASATTAPQVLDVGYPYPFRSISFTDWANQIGAASPTPVPSGYDVTMAGHDAPLEVVAEYHYDTLLTGIARAITAPVRAALEERLPGLRIEKIALVSRGSYQQRSVRGTWGDYPFYFKTVYGDASLYLAQPGSDPESGFAWFGDAEYEMTPSTRPTRHGAPRLDEMTGWFIAAAQALLSEDRPHAGDEPAPPSDDLQPLPALTILPEAR